MHIEMIIFVLGNEYVPILYPVITCGLAMHVCVNLIWD